MHDVYLFYVGFMTGIGAILAFFIVYLESEHKKYMKVINDQNDEILRLQAEHTIEREALLTGSLYPASYYWDEANRLFSNN